MFPANRVGIDIEIYRDPYSCSDGQPPLRQQTKSVCQLLSGGFCRAPKLSGKADYIGAFAVTGGLEERAGGRLRSATRRL